MDEIVAYTAYCFGKEERRQLLEKFPPMFANVKADHITIEYDVPLDTATPANPSNVQIIGYACDQSLEAMLVSVDGSHIRPNGQFYHITWSYNLGRTPAESNDLLTKSYVKFDEPTSINCFGKVIKFKRKAE